MTNIYDNVSGTGTRTQIDLFDNGDVWIGTYNKINNAVDTVKIPRDAALSLVDAIKKGWLV